MGGSPELGHIYSSLALLSELLNIEAKLFEALAWGSQGGSAPYVCLPGLGPLDLPGPLSFLGLKLGRDLRAGAVCLFEWGCTDRYMAGEPKVKQGEARGCATSWGHFLGDLGGGYICSLCPSTQFFCLLLPKTDCGRKRGLSCHSKCSLLLGNEVLQEVTEAAPNPKQTPDHSNSLPLPHQH